jgi:hypothetical protein
MALSTHIVPDATDALTAVPFSAADMLATKIRLGITVGGGCVSAVAGIVMLVAYRRYHAHVVNHFNNLYVLGMGGFGLIQSISAAIFAAIHLTQLEDYSAAACIVNASVQQFCSFGGQVFALAFIVSLVMLRGTLCDGCFKSSVSVVEVMRRQQRPKTRLLSRTSQSGSLPGTPRSPAPLPRDVVTSSAALTTPRTRLVPLLEDAASREGIHLSSSETFYSDPTCWSSHRGLVPWIWPVAAVLGGTITTIVMLVVVVQDPLEKPSVGPIEDPKNFQVLLGWCWIPDNHNQLRFWCSYFLSVVTFVMAVTALVVLGRFEAGITWGLHANVYLRLISLCIYIAVAYLLGAVSIFTSDAGITRYVGYAATAVFTLGEAWIAFVFLATERVFVQFFVDRSAATVPGNGFSRAINHLLVITVEGAYVPSSVNRFPTSRDPLGVIDSQRVIDDDAQSYGTEVMSTRRLMQAYDEDYRSPGVPSNVGYSTMR